MYPVFTHPSPLPEGEGTDRVDCWQYADLKYRDELRFEQHEDRLSFLSRTQILNSMQIGSLS